MVCTKMVCTKRLMTYVYQYMHGVYQDMHGVYQDMDAAAAVTLTLTLEAVLDARDHHEKVQMPEKRTMGPG
jgi:hypothetical protein